VTLAADESLGRIEVAIEAEDLAPAPGVLVGYLLLTEWVSSDGDTYLVESHPEEQTFWRSLGYIEAARMSINHAHRPQDDEDEDEE
jgi:hypothetical protein